MLTNETWQAVPGLATTQVYPIIKKTNITTANAFLLQSPGMIMIIDPGNLPEQIETIRRTIAAVLRQDGRPVIAFITHCHVDHCFEFLQNPSAAVPDGPVFVALQESGFEALASRNKELTGAGRYKRTIPEPNIDIRLLSAEDRRFNTAKQFMLTGDARLDITTKTIKTSGGKTLSVQDISVNGDGIRVYHTPGHTADSVSYQVGEMLFVGDLMFAADPFIAGLPGWNKSQASASAENLLWLIENQHISHVAQGHGEVVSSEKATVALQSMIRRLETISVRKELDLPTILASSEYAVDLFREVTDITAVMTESLSRVVYYLNMLEESAEATRYQTALDPDKLSQLSAAFDKMIDQMHSGQLIEVGLVLRSALLFNKIKEMLNAEGLECVVGQGLLSRLERAFDDFITACSGRDVKYTAERVEIGDLLRQVIETRKQDLHADQSILDTLDDERQFIAALTRRIAFKPALEAVNLNISRQQEIWIETDRQRLVEIVDIFIDLLTDAGSSDIVFRPGETAGTIHLEIDGGVIPRALVEAGRQKRMLTRRLSWINGDFGLENRGNALVIDVTLPPRNG